jgi:hypothetical protein
MRGVPVDVGELLDRYGTTYAAEAGITLRDKPSPLYQLLVLTALLSTRIRADIAVTTAREVFHAGWKTPKAMRASTWQERVAALGRGGYKRYDESTARLLDEGAAVVLDGYGGDLRRMREAADGDERRLRALLTEVPRIGPTGSRIFCREVQGVWPEIRPFFDQRALKAAGEAGLPTDPDRLADLVAPDDLPRLAAALVRFGLDRR